MLPQSVLKNLRTCQISGYTIATALHYYGFFWDRGVGKTILELCITLNKIQYGKVLIVTKEDLIYDNILQERNDLIKKYNFPEFRFATLLGSRKIISIKKKIFESHYLSDNYRPQVYLTSFNVFRDLWSEVCNGINTLIIDESGLLRNTWSKLSLAFRHAKDKYDFKNIYLLSGLPAPNSELEYFTQLYLIAQDKFGKSFEKYKEENFRIAKQSEPNAGKYVLKNPIEFKEKLKGVSEYISRHDIFKNIPEPIQLKRYFPLTDEQQVYYDIVITQTKKYIREHGGELEILIPYIVKQIRWLQVICGLYVAEDGTKIRLKTNLYDTIWDVIEDIYEPVLFWCNFDYEQANIVNYLAKKNRSVGFVHGGQLKKDQRIARQAFKDGKVQNLVLKPQANAHGHNFQNVCSFVVYPTLTYSLDNKEQSFDRVFRPPYIKACTELCLIAKNTVQEVIYEAVQNKKNSALEVLNYLKAS